MELSNNQIKRITYKRARPNPLFQEWLEELYEEAKKSRSRLEPMLKEALHSLSKYPLPLQSGAECAILKGFGKKLCAHLHKRLEVYNYNLALAQHLEASSGTSSASSSRNSDCSSPLSCISNVEHRVNQYKHLRNICNGAAASNEISTINHNVVIDEDYGVKRTVVASTSKNSEFQSPIRQQNENMAKKKYSYKPAYRSGAYAILITLLEHSKENLLEKSLTREELINRAEKISRESFLKSKYIFRLPFCTAWSNMIWLVNEGLVIETIDEDERYVLTAEGTELAEELLKDAKHNPSDNVISFNSMLSTSSFGVENIYENECTPTDTENNNDPEILFPTHLFNIILLIDKNETSGASNQNDPTVAQFKKYPDLKHEYRSLKVGDYAWIARHKMYKEQELVLPIIVERKRMDDLAASIKDGRFHEQKFRLRKCGLKNVLYLIECHGTNKNVGLPIQSLKQALANTRIQDEFQVYTTYTLADSVRFLATMTQKLTLHYQGKCLKGGSKEATEGYLMTFEYFNKASAKTKPLTVTETFIKLLLQLKGVSVEKALAITAKFNTPKSLIIEYQKCDRSSGECLLANIKYGSSGRNVGPAVSKAIYQLFSKIGE